MDHRLTVFHPGKSVRGEFILYLVRHSLRMGDNLALQWAITQARGLNLPLEIVTWVECQGLPGREAFYYQGLVELFHQIQGRGGRLSLLKGELQPSQGAGWERAALVVTDFRPLPGEIPQLESWARHLACPLAVVEDNTSQPIQGVSGKQEWSAATFRPKLIRSLQAEGEAGPWGGGPPGPRDFPPSTDIFTQGWVAQGGSLVDIADLKKHLDTLPLFPGQTGGETPALDRWETFLDQKIHRYDQDGQDPNREGTSGLSPALRFGFISPLTLVRTLTTRGLWAPALTYKNSLKNSVAKFVDEVLVRRELAANYVFYQPQAGTWEGLPAWAQKTLEKHRTDPREFLYELGAWEAGETHDPAWNACQNQLKTTGLIHGQMRMYWGKKILEWSASAAQGLETAQELNRRWALDAPDANSLAAVAWCWGLHDRPWGERPIYGLVRSMTEKGLRRKFDLDAYIQTFTPRR